MGAPISGVQNGPEFIVKVTIAGNDRIEIPDTERFFIRLRKHVLSELWIRHNLDVSPTIAPFAIFEAHFTGPREISMILKQTVFEVDGKPVSSFTVPDFVISQGDLEEDAFTRGALAFSTVARKQVSDAGSFVFKFLGGERWVIAFREGTKEAGELLLKGAEEGAKILTPLAEPLARESRNFAIVAFVLVGVYFIFQKQIIRIVA